MNLDPRDIIEADPYNVLTSDEDEEAQMQREIKHMETMMLDMQKRLKAKKERKKINDPNFNSKQIQVPSSPPRVKHVELSHETFAPKSQKGEDDTVNPNELALKNQLNSKNSHNNIPDNTTNYFMSKFAESKRKEQAKIVKTETMLQNRVHTFNGYSSKKYNEIIVDETDEYCKLNLCKRYVPKDKLDEMFKDVKVLRLNKLFAKVRPPKFQEPQYANWVTFGIIFEKSEVKFTSTSKPKKFIKFRLTNFQYQIELFIFGDSGVSKYYNLRKGDIIALLNPEIWPERPTQFGNGNLQKTIVKSFNLSVSHNFNCILEVGKSKDLDYCMEVDTRTKIKCNNVINKAVERECEYHKEIKLRKFNAKRLDLQTGYSAGAPIKPQKGNALYKYTDLKNNHSNSGGSGANKRFQIVQNSTQKSGQDEFSYSKRQFSSKYAAKAFFDDEFSNPDMISNLDSKRRKIQASVRQLQLDKSLDQLNSKNKAKLKKQGDSFVQGNIIQRIGFDPTNGVIRETMKQSIRDGNNAAKGTRLNDKNNMIKELLTLKKPKIDLRPAKEVLLAKKRHREQIWSETFETKQRDDNSDSDLDII